MFDDTFRPFTLTTSHTPPITISGLRGPSTGPPLLLLHGFPQTHVIWRKVAPALAPHFTLVIIDLRGYGASSRPAARSPSDHSLMAKGALASDCASVMAQLGLDRSGFYVCGHDRGGRVAHKLSVDRPEKVRKVMVLDICPTKVMYETTAFAFAKAYWHWFFLIQPAPVPETVLLKCPDMLIERMVGRAEGDGGDVFGAEAIAAYKALLRDEAAVHSMCEDYRASAQEDIRESTEDLEAGRMIRCPVRVHWGRMGVIERLFDARAEWCRVSEEGMLDAEQSGALECGHYLPEERPEELIGSMIEFFGG